MTKVLIDGDFANIEGRANAWLAGEEWKLQAFRDFDAGIGPDLYKVAYSKAFGIPHQDVTKPQRQRGKVMELALGYQGGVGAFLKLGPTYGLRPVELVQPVQEATDSAKWEKTLAAYDKATNKLGLVREQWAAIQTLVHGWRQSNPKIVQSWWNLQQAAIQAVDNPGQLVIVPNYRGVSYLGRGGFLWCRLPSGRHLSYFNPRIQVSVKRSLLVHPTDQEKREGVQDQLHNIDDFPPDLLMDYIWSGRAEIVTGKERKEVVFEGKLPQGGAGGTWGRKHFYGGLQCENIVQAASYDVQTSKMLDLDDARFPIVMHTHDSITSEVDLCEDTECFGDKNYSHKVVTQRYAAIMGAPLSWAPDLPIKVEVHASERYAG